MNRLAIIHALGPIDLRNVGRDSLLRWIILAPLAAALAARWLLPLLLVEIEALINLPLLPYYPPIMGYTLLFLVPFLVGFVIGFLLLDQRDDGTLVALQVTPLSLNGYLTYRMAFPMLISVLASFIVLPISGLAPLRWWQLLLVSAAAAPQAPLFALALAALAQNKVQGFALTKAAGVVLLPSLIAYFIHFPWQLLLGIVPTYWPAQLFWKMLAGEQFWPYLVVGLVYQGVVLWWLLRRFNRVMTR